MSNPFEPPLTDEARSDAQTLAEPKPITLRYELQMAPVGKSLEHALLKGRGGLFLLALIVAGVALLFFLPVLGILVLVWAGLTIAGVVTSVYRPTLVRRGRTEDVEMAFSSGGVRVVAAGLTHARRWGEMSHYAEGQGLISLFPDSKTAWPVPTAKLTIEELRGVRAWLEACLSTRPRAQPARNARRVLVLWVLLILVFWAIYQVMSKEHGAGH